MSAIISDFPLRKSLRVAGVIRTTEVIVKLENKLKRKEAMRLVSLSICKKMKKKQEALQFMIDSYLTQIKNLEQEVKELKEKNYLNMKCTWDMVKNPIISKNMDPFSQSYLILQNGEKLYIPSNNILDGDTNPHNYKDLESNKRRFEFEKRFRRIPFFIDGKYKIDI